MLGIVLALLAASSAGSPCSVDTKAMLSLDETRFDQSPGEGWRQLTVSGSCDKEAANLIEQYRTHHKSRSSTLFWHEGQLRANAGDYRRAIRLFDKAKHPKNEFGIPDGWNEYVEASIAFLRRDRRSLEAARSALASLPEPDAIKDANKRRPEGRKIAWPPNLDAVDGLVRCFDEPYKKAYLCR